MPCGLPAGRVLMKKKNARSPAARALFLLYCAAMFWLLFGQRIGEPSYLAQIRLNINLTPFRTIRQYWSLLQNQDFRIHAFVNLVGNVVMFIPLGYLLPKIWKRFRNFIKLFFFVLISILIVEMLQYVTMLGSFDVDDVILNLIGVILGYLGWLIFGKN